MFLRLFDMISYTYFNLRPPFILGPVGTMDLALITWYIGRATFVSLNKKRFPAQDVHLPNLVGGYRQCENQQKSTDFGGFELRFIKKDLRGLGIPVLSV